MKKEITLIDKNKKTVLTNIPGFVFLNSIEGDVQLVNNSIEINGNDGVLNIDNRFAPFSLELNCVCTREDVSDYKLFKTKLRSIIYKRRPYYIIHSDMPGKKYEVIPQDIEIEDKFGKNGEITLKFLVYKGFSESVNTTSKDFSFQSNWMFENGIPLDFNPVYYHESNQFTIWNGSTDTIDPRNIYHQLKIKLNINAEDGFELVNYTTGDIFKYHKSITEKETFVLNGIHAYKDNNKVGIDTNRGLITLAPGKNIIKVKGDVKSQKVLFEFPFIYR